MNAMNTMMMMKKKIIKSMGNTLSGRACLMQCCGSLDSDGEYPLDVLKEWKCSIYNSCVVVR